MEPKAISLSLLLPLAKELVVKKIVPMTYCEDFLNRRCCCIRQLYLEFIGVFLILYRPECSACKSSLVWTLTKIRFLLPNPSTNQTQCSKSKMHYFDNVDDLHTATAQNRSCQPISMTIYCSLCICFLPSGSGKDISQAQMY